MKGFFVGLHGVLKRGVLMPVRFYRGHLSGRKKASCCRFLPTCSEYCIEAVEEWGIIVGLVLSIWRILRCNPLCKGGYDPVPERKGRKKN